MHFTPKKRRKKRSLETAVVLAYWDEWGMPSPQGTFLPWLRVPASRLTQPVQRRPAQNAQQWEPPGHRAASHGDQKGAMRAGMMTSASHIYTSALAVHTVHIWATHLTSWVHRPFSPCSQEDKKNDFSTKIIHFTAIAFFFFFIHSLLDQFYVYIIKYLMDNYLSRTCLMPFKWLQVLYTCT